MATNKYFNNYSAEVHNEQRLLEDMVVESIRINGHDIQYLPREVYDSYDDVLGEAVNSKFNKAYTIEAYLANVEGYEGDGDFFSKFGLEVRDTSNFVVSRRSFERYIPSNVATRPKEGDLLYVPVLQKIFEIKFVEEELLFFALGRRQPYIYELRCEVFRYSNESITTGVDEIDDFERDISYVTQIDLGNGTGDYMIGEQVYQGANLASASIYATVKDWTASEKKLEVINIVGAFTANTTVRGESSNAQYTCVSSDAMADLIKYEDSDNRVLQDEAGIFINTSESNPFGMP